MANRLTHPSVASPGAQTRTSFLLKAVLCAVFILSQPLAQAETFVELPIPKSPASKDSTVTRGYWIHVVRPRFGEKLSTGKTYPIQWQASHYVGKVRIYLYRNGRYVATLGNTNNDGSAAWRVPTSAPAGTGYSIAVQSHTLPDVYDFSSRFTIQKTTSAGGGYKVCTYKGKKNVWASKKMSYYINRNISKAAQAAIKKGASVWNKVPGSVFKFTYKGLTTRNNHGARDGKNIVTAGPLKAGVLAVNQLWFLTSSGKLISSDIRFNTRYPWAVNGAKNAFDVQSTAAHEFGHSLCLKDLYTASDKGKTMYGRGGPGETHGRTLDPADKRGIAFLY